MANNGSELTKSKIVAAGPPFDRSDADTILRSSDGVDFHIHRIILMLSSQVFNDMFSLPQPREVDAKATIELPEDSETLRALLDALYPIQKPTIQNLSRAHGVLTSASKYEMQKVITTLGEILSTFIATEPLRVFAIACRAGITDVVQASANILMWRQVNGVYIEELEKVPAGCYHRLLQYLFEKQKRETLVGFCLRPTGSICPPPIIVPLEYELPKDRRLFVQAGPPFDAIDADVVLITTDKVEFKVLRSVVSLSSSIIKEEIDLAEKSTHCLASSITQSSMPGCPPVEVSIHEDSIIFKQTLQLCYPSGTSSDMSLLIATTKSSISILKCAVKYRMTHAIWVLQTHWDAIIQTGPLHAYLVAITNGWKLQTLEAAKYLLALPIDDLRSLYTSELEHFLTGPYFRLLRYHEQCSQEIRKRAHSIIFKPENGASLLETCCSKQSTTSPLLQHDLIKQITSDFMTAPSSLTITSSNGSAFRRLVTVATGHCGPRCASVSTMCRIIGENVDRALVKCETVLFPPDDQKMRKGKLGGYPTG